VPNQKKANPEGVPSFLVTNRDTQVAAGTPGTNTSLVRLELASQIELQFRTCGKACPPGRKPTIVRADSSFRWYGANRSRTHPA